MRSDMGLFDIVTLRKCRTSSIRPIELFSLPSSGKGLGAQEDGETENIKVKVKNDKHGIGANNDYSDTWLDHQDDFNSILASLNTCHSAPGSGTATPTHEVS